MPSNHLTFSIFRSPPALNPVLISFYVLFGVLLLIWGFFFGGELCVFFLLVWSKSAYSGYKSFLTCVLCKCFLLSGRARLVTLVYEKSN